MATAKKQTDVSKMTPTQLKKKNQELEEKLAKFQSYGYCYMCDTHKCKEGDYNKFYISTDPMNKSGVTPICKECAKKIALRVDKNGHEHEPTKDSCQLALRYLNKPFINNVWNASIQESDNLVAGKTKSNVWSAYVKNIAMGQYVGLTYFDSDFYKEKIIYEDEKTESQIIEEHAGQDTYDSYLKNKSDVIRLLNYDPFEQEAISDQPFLYSQLLGLLDSSEDANEDMVRVSSSISIVRGFLQSSKIDDTITKLMSDISNIERNSATIKSLQDSKSKITSMITSLAEASCISLKHNKKAAKSTNTWTGKLKELKSLNIREADVNGFDIETCKGMQQVADISMSAIIKKLNLQEDEYSDMLAEQRVKLAEAISKANAYCEASRILLNENINLRKVLSDNKLINDDNLIDLDELVNTYMEHGGVKDEQ